MKKIFFCFILFFNFSNVLSEETIHFLDIEFILNNSNSGKIIIEELEKINSKNISELKIQEEELKNLENNISKVKKIISEEELQNKVENLKKKITLYRNQKDKKSKEFNNFREKKLKDFFKRITPIIEEFMKKNSIPIIMDKKNIFIANSKYDITNNIIELLNKLEK